MRADTASSLLINDSRKCLPLSTFPGAAEDHGPLFPLADVMAFWVSRAQWPAEAGWVATMDIYLCSPGRICNPDLWGLSGRLRWVSCGFRKWRPKNLLWSPGLLLRLASRSWDRYTGSAPTWSSSVALHTTIFVLYGTAPEVLEHLV